MKENIFDFPNLPLEMQLLVLEKMDDKQKISFYQTSKHAQYLINNFFIKKELEKIELNQPAKGNLSSYLAFRKYLSKEVKQFHRLPKIKLKFFEGIDSLTHPYDYQSLLLSVYNQSPEAKLLLFASIGDFDEMIKVYYELNFDSRYPLLQEKIDYQGKISNNPYYLIKLYAKYYNAIKEKDLVTLESLKNLGILFADSSFTIRNNPSIKNFLTVLKEENQGLTSFIQDNIKLVLDPKEDPKVRNNALLLNRVLYFIILDAENSIDNKGELVKQCLDLGANINNYLDDKCANPTYVAFATVNFEIIPMLIENHATLFPLVYEEVDKKLVFYKMNPLVELLTDNFLTIEESIENLTELNNYYNKFKNFADVLITLCEKNNQLEELGKFRGRNLINYLTEYFDKKESISKKLCDEYISKIKDAFMKLAIKNFKEGKIDKVKENINYCIHNEEDEKAFNKIMNENNFSILDKEIFKDIIKEQLIFKKYVDY